MGNICPANKGAENGAHTYKHGNSSREPAYKLGMQRGGLGNAPLNNPINMQTHLQYPNNNNNNLQNENDLNNFNPSSMSNQNMLMKRLQNQHHGSMANGVSSLLAQQSSNPLDQLLHGVGMDSQHNVRSVLEKPNYIALFDYDSATKDDMTIKKTIS